MTSQPGWTVRRVAKEAEDRVREELGLTLAVALVLCPARDSAIPFYEPAANFVASGVREKQFFFFRAFFCERVIPRCRVFAAEVSSELMARGAQYLSQNEDDSEDVGSRAARPTNRFASPTTDMLVKWS